MSKILLTRHQREMIPHFKENLINHFCQPNHQQMTVKEAISETIDNSVGCDIDRRIIKHVIYDQEKVTKAMNKLIGGIADSNHIKLIIDEDFEKPREKSSWPSKFVKETERKKS